MTILVIAEHDNKQLKPGVTNTVAAAAKIGGDVSVLVAGSQCGEAAAAAAKIAGVAKVLVADAPHYAVPLAENMAALVVSIADKFTHILAPATGFGKNFMPRAAALLDVAQVSDISAVVSPDTFVRSIYAGNALATVQSKDRIKIITVRITGFDAAGAAASPAPGPRVKACQLSATTSVRKCLPLSSSQLRVCSRPSMSTPDPHASS